MHLETKSYWLLYLFSILIFNGTSVKNDHLCQRLDSIARNVRANEDEIQSFKLKSGCNMLLIVTYGINFLSDRKHLHKNELEVKNMHHCGTKIF